VLPPTHTLRRWARSSLRRALPPSSILVVACGLATPAPAQAQEGCRFVAPTRSLRQVPVGGAVNRYVGSPHLLCADGVEMWADSAVEYSQLGMSLFMGSVRYRDRTQELRADTARYLSRQERLQAHGNLFIRNEDDGSQIENGVLVYLRQSEFRDEESMTVTVGNDGVRPRALLRVGGGAGGEAEQQPYTVIANQIDLRGDSYFSSTGDVEISRDSLSAYADSAEFDQVRDQLVLVGTARVLSRGTELTGRTITLTAPGADTSRIRSTRDALLVAEGVRLESPQIIVFLVDDAAERLVATPVSADTAAPAPSPDSAEAAQPIATLENAVLTGDSLEILAPAEVVDRVIAVGRARSQSSARDSLNVESLPEIARSDWLEGDTVIVTFRSARPAGPDSTRSEGKPGGEDEGEIETVSARGGARALYRLEPTDSSSRAGVDPPALHYVLGRSITITMGDGGGGVSDIHVEGQTRGVHLEPLARRMVSDTLGADTARIDTLRIDTLRVDTLAQPPDTTRVDTLVTAPAADASRPIGERRRPAPTQPRPAEPLHPWRPE
jgi:lipopolysaccharide export system protein LptA